MRQLPFSGVHWSGLDALLVAPPVSLIESPNLALHTLQAVAERAGFKVRVLYADQLFAKFIGVEKFEFLSHSLMSPYEQYGERLFCRAAFKEMPPLGGRVSPGGLTYQSPRTTAFEQMQWASIVDIYEKVDDWLDAVTNLIVSLNAPIIGLSTSHQQTTAAIAIARALRAKQPDVLVAIGGANCHGQMAEGILQASGDCVNYVFAGEAELLWLNLLNALRRNDTLPASRILPNEPLKSLDDLPIPVFNDFFDQRIVEPEKPSDVWLNIESSRGCWWGQKYLCTFCGINGETLTYRAKSAERVFQEVSQLLASWPTAQIRMTDVLMPRHYFKKLLPKIALNFPDITIFYEQRADISLKEVLQLKDAGIRFLQVGIEHFSDSLLRRIDKGTTCRDNINLLRYARTVGCSVGWNLLSAVPNDTEEEWLQLKLLIPLIQHLSPPTLLRPVEITRFSPYFENASKFGISNLRPLEVYSDLFPNTVDPTKLAWLFTGDYGSFSRNNLEFISQMHRLVEAWKKSWMVPISDLPVLEVHPAGSNRFMLRDRRENLTQTPLQMINEKQASVALMGSDSPHMHDFRDWAIKNGVVFETESYTVGLATASVNVLTSFETTYPPHKVSWKFRTQCQTASGSSLLVQKGESNWEKVSLLK